MAENPTGSEKNVLARQKCAGDRFIRELSRSRSRSISENLARAGFIDENAPG